MSIWEQVKQAQSRWRSQLEQESEKKKRWMELQKAILGDPQQVEYAITELRSLRWGDAMCSLFSVEAERPLRFAADIHAIDKINTISAIIELSSDLHPSHVLSQLQKMGKLNQLLLRLCTKSEFSQLLSLTQKQLIQLSFRMKTVTGGEHTIGNINHFSEQPTHLIELEAFQIGVYPTTQALWGQVFAKSHARYFGASRPIESISWLDAIRFCNQLSIQQNKEPCYHIQRNQKGKIVNVEWRKENRGYRLPTEAEWEVAASGPQKESVYAGGNDIRLLGWCEQNTGTRPIGQKQANEYGLYDMSGNVFEWCWDRYGHYAMLVEPKGAKQQEQMVRKEGMEDGPAFGECRVYRGGCWNMSAEYARVSSRLANIATLKSPSIGLRLVCSI